MIPWKISENGRTRISFNANIGRTLAALLPEKAALKERIGGVYFRRTLSVFVYGQICPEWRKLGGNSNVKFRLLGCNVLGDFDPCYLPGKNWLLP
jgi:hypothetical protein